MEYSERGIFGRTLGTCYIFRQKGYLTGQRNGQALGWSRRVRGREDNSCFLAGDVWPGHHPAVAWGGHRLCQPHDTATATAYFFPVLPSPGPVVVELHCLCQRARWEQVMVGPRPHPSSRERRVCVCLFVMGDRIAKRKPFVHQRDAKDLVLLLWKN